MTSTVKPKQMTINAMPLGLLAAHGFLAMITVLIASAAYGFCRHDDDDDDDSNNGMLQTMAFYGVYHSDPINQVIHFIFVPCIFWSLFMIASHVPIIIPTATGTTVWQIPALPGIPRPHRCTWGTLNLLIYIIFYTYIDWKGSVCYFPFLYALYASAVRFYQADQNEAKMISDGASSSSSTGQPSSSASSSSSWIGTGRLIRRAWVLHALAWYMQIHPGHKIFEGSQPAIFQSLGGALTSAPLFAFYEGVWALGLRRDLQQQVLVRVEDLRR